MHRNTPPKKYPCTQKTSTSGRKLGQWASFPICRDYFYICTCTRAFSHVSPLLPGSLKCYSTDTALAPPAGTRPYVLTFRPTASLHQKCAATHGKTEHASGYFSPSPELSLQLQVGRIQSHVAMYMTHQWTQEHKASILAQRPVAFTNAQTILSPGDKHTFKKQKSDHNPEGNTPKIVNMVFARGEDHKLPLQGTHKQSMKSTPSLVCL